MVRKSRDYDAELQALTERSKKIRSQKTAHIGELVQVVGADAFSLEALAGVLLEALEQAKGHPEKEAGWAERGRTFLQPGGKRGKKAEPAKPAARAESS